MTPAKKPSRRTPRSRRARRALASLVRRATDAIASIGLREWHFYGGLAIAAAGGAQISVACTLVAVGSVIALVGLRGIR